MPLWHTDETKTKGDKIMTMRELRRELFNLTDQDDQFELSESVTGGVTLSVGGESVYIGLIPVASSQSPSISGKSTPVVLMVRESDVRHVSDILLNTSDAVSVFAYTPCGEHTVFLLWAASTQLVEMVLGDYAHCILDKRAPVNTQPVGGHECTECGVLTSQYYVCDRGDEELCPECQVKSDCRLSHEEGCETGVWQ